MKQYRVGILGATGAVGQQFVQLLAEHPWFTVTEVVASQKSAGSLYAEVVRWRLATPLPADIGKLKVKDLKTSLECDFVFSALDSTVAGPAEEALAGAGYPVVSNSSSHRMESDVPLLVPEVNPDHCQLISTQRKRRRSERGFIVTNPNCSTVGLVMPLKPLHDSFGVEAVSVVTMQAISGAGYPGVSAADVVENVIPNIAGEEEKVEAEPLKILGTLSSTGVQPAEMKISAQCHRVPVLDGHLEAASIKLRKKTTVKDVIAALESFSGEPQESKLPSAPPRPIIVRAETDRPQPRLDRDAGQGMAVVVGRVRECPVFDVRMTILSHNLIRGAAGAAILNAELLAHNGYM
jgi:aspartate-semialdehyde dehydrogenase